MVGGTEKSRADFRRSRLVESKLGLGDKHKQFSEINFVCILFNDSPSRNIVINNECHQILFPGQKLVIEEEICI